MMRKKKQCMFGEYDDEGAFTVLEFISSSQVQSKAPVYKLVKNFTGYQNIWLLLSKYSFIIMIY